MLLVSLFFCAIGQLLAERLYGVRYSTVVIVKVENALDDNFVDPIVINIPKDDENFCYQYQSIFAPLNLTKLCGDISHVQFSLTSNDKYVDAIEDYLFITTNTTTITDASVFGFSLFDNVKNISMYVQIFANFTHVNGVAAQNFIINRGNQKLLQAYIGILILVE